MSKSLFPIKVALLFQALKNSGVLDIRKTASQNVNPPDDGLDRAVLHSPEIKRVVSARLNLPDFRVRIALPASWHLCGEVADHAQLEVYTVAGEPAMEPIKLTKLEDDYANAIQAELYNALLESKGVHIPMV